MFKEFKEFAVKGNVIDMAVGIVIGAAFGLIVKSLVDDLIMPPVGLLLGKVDFANLFVVLKDGTQAGPYATVADAKAAGAVTLSYGAFINTIINFLIVAFAMFLVVKQINRLKRKSEPAAAAPATTRKCPYCLSDIPLEARKCAHCTSDVPASA